MRGNLGKLTSAAYLVQLDVKSQKRLSELRSRLPSIYRNFRSGATPSSFFFACICVFRVELELLNFAFRFYYSTSNFSFRGRSPQHIHTFCIAFCIERKHYYTLFDTPELLYLSLSSFLR